MFLLRRCNGICCLLIFGENKCRDYINFRRIRSTCIQLITIIKIMAPVELKKLKQSLLETFQRKKTQKLLKLRQENKFCNLILKSDDGFEIEVHRNVLSSASNYFEDLLTTPMSEMHQDCISLPDITGVVLEKIISFIYTNEFDEEIEDIEKIIKYAVIFQLEELIEMCSLILVENITDNTCLRYWRSAKYNLIYSLESKCLAYIISKADDLFQKELLNDCTIEEMRCMLAEDSLHLQFDEQTIFEYVWKWTTGKVCATITFPQVFSQVVDLLRFSKLNRDFLVERIFCNEQLLEDAELLKQIGKLTNKQILQDDDKETANKQKSQDDKNKPPSKRVDISKITSRRLLGFGCNRMFKGFVKHEIDNEKRLPQDFGFGYTTFGNNLFICGGLNSTSCEWLEPISDKWEKLPSLKSPKQSHGCSYFDNKIYACGGFASNTVEIFDFGNEKWYSGPNMMSKISHFGLTPVNGSLYAIGDNMIQILDSREKEWNVINSTITQIEPCYGCVSIGSSIYCFYRDKRKIYDTRVNKFVDEISLTGNPGSNFCELDGFIYSFACYADVHGSYSMSLFQHSLDGTLNYKKNVGIFGSMGGTALVALNY